MRLGGPLYDAAGDPAAWIAAVRSGGFTAAYCPIDHRADDATVAAYRLAAEQADIVIAEVGAWSNPLSPDAGTSAAALRYCQEQLALADRIGARCCVNIAGSRGDQWHGPHADNLTAETFDRVVDAVRAIIDAVKPKRTAYTLETMPWMFPYSAESYLRLLKAIDRPAFAVHLDPVNLICSPDRYYANADLLRHCFSTLGPYIKSCHAKDIALAPRLTTHLDEVRPGLGALDYRVFLSELSRVDADVPLMLEHLPTHDEVSAAAAYIRSVAAELDLAA